MVRVNTIALAREISCLTREINTVLPSIGSKYFLCLSYKGKSFQTK